MSAAEKVLNLPELLENILKYVPRKDLLIGAMRTCHGFKTAIVASRTIQKRLYRLTEVKNAEIWFNPLFLSPFNHSVKPSRIKTVVTFPLEQLFFGRSFCARNGTRAGSFDFPTCKANGHDRVSISRPHGIRFSGLMDCFVEFYDYYAAFNYFFSWVSVPKQIQAVTKAKTVELSCSKEVMNWVILAHGFGRPGRLWSDEIRGKWLGEWDDPLSRTAAEEEYLGWDGARELYIYRRSNEKAKEQDVIDGSDQTKPEAAGVTALSTSMA
ncbi:hypothetical protein LTR37_001459 [Vermiconidia calcicola]|uniref:Uncharacterized protein n=1 Tax=Vermiconidia calcicola TaxID=1690605 RepID=A0ACC3NW78_9PEZI|nr:hypothetical protein LTR37_001459 [Vermiconidia calcicola]